MARIYRFEEGRGLGSDWVDASCLRDENDVLDNLGITNGQLALLYVLDNQGHATRTELAFALVMDQWAVTLNLQEMEAFGAVEAIVKRDGRTQAFRLSEKGSQLLRVGVKRWRDSQADVAIGADQTDDYTTAKYLNQKR